MGILPMLSAEKTRKRRKPPIAERPTRRGAGETIRWGQNRSALSLILAVAPGFGLCFSRHLCALVILFASATLPAPFSTLMNAPRPAALLLLRSLIVALAWGGAAASVQAASVVSNISAAQRAGTKLVEVSCDVDSFRFSRATWTVSVTNAKEGIGTNAYPVTGRTITCNGVIDRPRSFSARMRFQVKIDNAIIPPELLRSI